MKKLFSLTLALFFSMAVFAQNIFSYDFNDASTQAAFTTGEANELLDPPYNNWIVRDLFGSGDYCWTSATINNQENGNALYSPVYNITNADTSGSIFFYVASFLEGSGSSASNTFKVHFSHDGGNTWYYLGSDPNQYDFTLSADGRWHPLTIPFSMMFTPGQNAQFKFRIVHVGGTCDDNDFSILAVDDVLLKLHRTSYWVYFDTWQDDGDLGTMTASTTGANGEYTFPTPTFTAPAGKVFAWWQCYDATAEYLDEDSYIGAWAAGAVANLPTHIVAVATFAEASEIVNYNVTYNSNGGSGTMPTVPCVQGAGHLVLDNSFIAPAGKRFKCYAFNADGTGESVYPGDLVDIEAGETGLTLYAIWEDDPNGGGQGGGTITSYTIHFDGNGGTGTMNDATVDAGDYYTVPSCGFTRSGYSFLTWNTQANGTGTSYSPGAEISINANLTLYAIWDQNGGQGGGTQGTSYTIRYNGNGGTGSMTEQTVTENSTITLRSCQFTRNGFTFTGWNTAANGTGASYNPGDEVVITSNITFYAQWAEDGQGGGGQGGGTTTSYTIHFVANGGTGTMNDANVDAGEYYTIPSCGFTRDGYTFLTWNTQPDGSGSSYGPGSEISISANLTLYAIWDQNGGQGGGTQGTTYTVRYNGNGGVGTMTEQTVADNTTITLRSCQFTRDGFTFTGWNTAADGTGASYNPGDEVTITSNMTFYAQWQRNGSSAINGVAMASVSIYPNPASNMVVVSGTNASRIEVLDLAGRIVRIAESTNTVSLSGLTNGVYTLRITAAEGIATRKLLKK